MSQKKRVPAIDGWFTLDEKAPEAEKARAPNLGIGKDKGKLAADWGKQISAYFELHKRYPRVKKNKTATVKVHLNDEHGATLVADCINRFFGFP